MRKNILLIVAAAICFSCNDVKVDEKKLDEAGDKLQKTVKKAADSAETKLERWKDKIDKKHSDTIH